MVEPTKEVFLPSWSVEFKSVAEKLSDKLVDEEKAVSFNENFDRDKVESIIQELLNSLIPDLVELRHIELKKEINLVKDDIRIADKELRMAKDAHEATKTELRNVEEKYDDILSDMKRKYQRQLTEVDSEVLKRDTIIDDMKTEKRDLLSENRKFLRKKDKEYEELLGTYKKMVEEKEIADAQVKHANKKAKSAEMNLRGKSVDLEQEMAWGKNQAALHLQKDRRLHSVEKELDEALIVLEERTKTCDESIERERYLQRMIDERDRTILSLQTQIGELTMPKARSVRSNSSTSNKSMKGGDTLANELLIVESRERIEEFELQVEDLETQAAELQGELAGARLQVQQVEKERDLLEAQLNQVRKDRDELEVQFKKTNIKNDELYREVTRLKPFEDQANNLAKRERELQSQVKAKGQELKKSQAEVEEANAEIKRLKRGPGSKPTTPTVIPAIGLDAAVEECEKEKAKLGKRIEQLEGELEQALEEALKNLTAADDIDDLRRRLAEAEENLKNRPSEDDMNELRRRLAEAEENLRNRPSEDDVEELRRQLAKANEDLEKAKQDLEKAKQDLEKKPSEDDLDELRRRLAEAEENLKNREDEIIELRRRLAEAEENLKKRPSEDDVDELRRQLAKAKEDLEKKSLDDDINELRRRLAEAEENLKKREDEINELRRRLAETEENLKKKLSEDDCDELRRRLAEVEEILKNREDEIIELRRRLAEAEENLKKKPSEDNCDELRRRLAEVEEILKNREAEIIELRRALAEANEKFNRAPTEDAVEELARRIDQVQRELDQEREASAKLREANAQLQETIRNLERDALARTAEHERQTRALIEEHARHITRLVAKLAAKHDDTIGSSSALAEFWEDMAKKIHARSVEVNDVSKRESEVNQGTRDQYEERLAQMNADIARDPSSPAAANTKRRVAGVKREIDRVNGIIEIFKRQTDWFDGLIPEFAAGEELAAKLRESARKAAAATLAATENARTEAEAAVLRAQAQAALARGEAEEARIAAGEAVAEAVAEAAAGTAAQNQVVLFRPGTRQARWLAGWRNRLQGLQGLFRGGDMRTVFSVIGVVRFCAFLFMLLTILTQARELAIWKSANAPLQRAFYANTNQQYSLCFRRPSWDLMWEFIFAIFTGRLLSNK